jgi:hypothetical protein
MVRLRIASNTTRQRQEDTPVFENRFFGAMSIANR